MEEWRDIFKGYQVSSLGRVKSLPRKGTQTKEERILKQSKDKNGYMTVHLSLDGNSKNKTIHRLVAMAFIPNPENKREVNHIDGNKENNCVSNLEWSTRSENIKHSYKNGLQKTTEKQKEWCSKLGKEASKKVLQYDLRGNFIKEWESVREIDRQLDIKHSQISSCCLNKVGYKTAGGFIWKYKDAE